MKRTVCLGLLTAALVIGTLSSEPGLSSAASNDDLEPSKDAVVVDDYETVAALQAPLSEAANELSELIESSGPTGWAGTAIGPLDDKLLVYWKGALPAPIQTKIAALQAEVDIVVVAVSYSKAEMQAQADAILIAENESGKPEQEQIHQVALDPGSNGLVVYVEQLEEGSRSALKAEYDMVVAIVEEPEAADLIATRQNDANPWSGGARINFVGGGICTDSFGLVDRTFGISLMVSAAHCADFDTVVTDGAGDYMGTVDYVKPDRDLMAISVEYLDGWVYDGAWNDATGYAKPVKGWVRNYKRQQLCFSGSVTGIRCGLVIQHDSVTADRGGYLIHDLVRARTGDDLTIAGYGDSGGPAFGHVAGTGFADLLARGTINFGLGGSRGPCLGQYLPGRKCYKRVLYMPISVAINNFGDLVIGGPAPDQPSTVTASRSYQAD